ncbi:uncharacterized protein PRCAT00005955001 [Priceomyces carsonii]|uniref:uncharacterized protein n=1 Tax=Priceomyces carsonii TaxID=28549 RepID=UPI002ED9DA4C|nr:unnamed protein product [Priceomyces carsonii]
MSSKRKTPGSSSSSSKKQKRAFSQDELKQFHNSTLKLVNELRADNDRPLTEPFIKLPSKKLYPDYYVVITSPITISDIQKKASKGKYSENPEEFLSDFKLLHDNALAYNDPESWIVADASRIYEFVDDQVKSFEESHGAPEEPSPLSKDSKKAKKSHKKEADHIEPENKSLELTFNNLSGICKTLVKEVADHEFPEIGVISGPFMDDIDPKEYPEYFKVIKKPTSFNNVLNKLDKGKILSSKVSILDNLQRFYDATSAIFTNAQTFNDPSSLIHQDSVKLQNFFEEKFNDVKSKAEEIRERKNKLKLKVKNPESKDQAPAKVKLSLKLKSSEEKSPDVPKKRSNKGIEVKNEDEIEPAEKDEIDEGSVQSSVEDEKEKNAKEVYSDDPEKNLSLKSELLMSAPSNVMGKSPPCIPESEAIIQGVSLSTSLSHVSQLTQLAYQQIQQVQSSVSLSKIQAFKQSLFPMHSFSSAVTMFDYKFKANGYASLSYTLSLAPDTSSFLSLKISLHSLLCHVKKPDLANGQTYVGMGSNEEFQCSLHVNEDEVTNSGEFFEDRENGKEDLLGILYDLKLSYGLNILSFECKVAPSLSKKIKKSPPKEESDEISGRHTRHQLQQMKMSWDVEQVKFFVICNSV